MQRRRGWCPCATGCVRSRPSQSRAHASRRRRRASRGTVPRPTSFAINLETKIFDHGVGEQRLAHLFDFVAGFRRGPRFDFEQDIFADFHARDVFEPETVQRALDRSPLRIEDSFSRRDEDSYLQLKSFCWWSALIFDSAQHLLVSLLDAAQIAPEPILVELLPRRLVPETAGVGADFVAEQDLAMMPSELELEIHQDDAALVEEFREHLVDLERFRIDLAK